MKIDDPFWSPRLALVAGRTIGDLFGKFETREGDVFHNFRRVAAGERGGHTGKPWFDGLIYETIGAASSFLARSFDAELDARLDAYIAVIAAAQAADPDGYLNTYTTLACPEHRFGEKGGNLLWQHDLYNAGCLVEAGVRHYRATGKTALLSVAVRFSDYLCRYIGASPRKNIVPAHSLPERAIVELYRLLRDEPELKERVQSTSRTSDYLELARFWLETRGRHFNRASYPRYMGEYAQDHIPLLEQREAVGHAVRATLLYDGLTAVGMELRDEKYLEASVRLWENAVLGKMHVSGGVGTERSEEKFSYEYKLPNDAYLETCAAVGLVSWSRSLNLAFGEARFMDVAERALYNCILAGISLSGDRYSYENPLTSEGDVQRWDWHSCPCCPPMLLKALADLELSAFCADPAGLRMDLYISGAVDLALAEGPVSVSIQTRYPWEGDVRLSISTDRPRAFTLRLRIPEWCRSWRLEFNGGTTAEPRMEKGYAVLDRLWADGDEVILRMEMPVERIEAHPYVAADRGLVAVQRGPLLYCLEGTDNPAGVDRRIAGDPGFDTAWRPELLGGVIEIVGKDSAGDGFVAVPYFAWANRGPGAMRVWLAQEGKDPSDLSLGGWSDRLYRPYGRDLKP